MLKNKQNIIRETEKKKEGEMYISFRKQMKEISTLLRVLSEEVFSIKKYNYR